jgi:hypothetical protein
MFKNLPFFVRSEIYNALMDRYGDESLFIHDLDRFKSAADVKKFGIWELDQINHFGYDLIF